MRDHAAFAGLTSFLLIAVLLAPAAFALWAGIASYESSIAADEAGSAPDLLATARYAISEQESLARLYQLEPDRGTEALFAQQQTLAARALRAAGALGPHARPAGIDDLIARQARYLAATEPMFTHLGRRTLSIGTAGEMAGRSGELLRLKTSLLTAIENALAREAKYDGRRRNIEQGVLIATPIVLMLNLGLALILLLIKRADARRSRDAARQEAESIRHSEQRFRALVQNSSDVVIIAGGSGEITYGSPTTETMWGYAANSLLSRSIRALIHPDDRVLFDDLWHQLSVSPGATRTMELRVEQNAGTWRHVEMIFTDLTLDPCVGGIVLTARDIEERKAFEEQLTHRAFYDSLTGLPNRLLFHDRIEQGLARSSRHGGIAGLLFIDLDNFKLINDSLGHEVGDQLLIEVAARLLACVRAEDTVARLGGDEFVVLIEGMANESAAAAVADAIGEQFKRPFSLGGRGVAMTASIGVACGDASQEKAEFLLQKADVAMYRAKSKGRGQHVVFDASMHQDSLARLELENDLRRAIGNNELRIHYQPIVDMSSGRLVEVEALVRWQHPTKGLVPPLDFIPVAEETGLIVPLGAWVLEHACRQAAEWQISCPVIPPLTMSVNLSPRQFRQPYLDKEIAQILQRTGMNPACLKLEITEGAIMEDVDRTIATLDRLKALGCRLAVDDFGTGYSSLAYLKRLPLDVLKIDRSFVNGIGKNAEDTAIVQAIMSLAKSLNLSVTGEGVETASQAATLNQMACNQGQGFFFARPLEPQSIVALLTQSTNAGEIALSPPAPQPAEPAVSEYAA